MVPPLVTARRLAPSRARTRSATRSHTMRGRSSLNSSRRVAAGQQVEHGGEHVVGEVGEAGAAAHERGQLVDRPLLHRRHGHDLLGQHVERVAEVAGLLDEAVAHAPHDDGRLEQVAPVLGEDACPSTARPPVAGPADALQAAADGARRLDLDHEVDGAHVDAELEAAGGDEAAQLAPLQLVLDDDALLAGQRAVVGLDQLAARRPASTPSVSASSFSRAARRSARRRALQKMMVERWASTSSRMRG